MRTFIFCVLGISVIGILFLNAESRSMPVCGPCESEECQERSCLCGTTKDDCNCCDLCRKCSGEPCSIMIGDLCEEGFVCSHPPGTDFVDRYNFPGVCVPGEESSEE